MTSRKRITATAVAVVLTAGAVTGASAVPSPGTAGASPPVDGGAARAGAVVTLITGDRVLMNTDGDVREIRNAKGRESVRMSVSRIGGNTYVIPSDARRLIARKALDRRLFDVTGLVEAGYDDAGRDTVPLIVSYGTRSAASARSGLTGAGASVRRSLPAVHGAAVLAPKRGGSKVWRSLTATASPSLMGAATTGIERVWLDARGRVSLDRSTAQIGAPAAWEAGYTGAGVKVAVLDTGVDETHPDLAGAVIGKKTFSDADNSEDHFGHGTHVASIAAGSGAKSGGTYKGVAPGAKILDAKVTDDRGFGSASSVIAGMQWAADQGAKVANVSLGFPEDPENDPMKEAVDRLSKETGILFVISAGNSGPDARTVTSPGSAEAALTVGAVDRDDSIAGFSSAGPAVDGSLKPDITAPGVDIVAAKAARGMMGSPAADGYVSASGTSMAAPHVAGAAAILAQRHPQWPGERIKQALTASATPGAGLTPYQQGTGRADVAKALTQTVVSEQTSVNFGTARWPHTDDKPVAKTLTYRNDGTGAVTLDLALETRGPDGGAALDGFFRLGTERITVAPGESTDVRLTADTSVGGVDGDFSGTVVATATEGGHRVRTTLGVVREVESYSLTMKYLDNKGEPAAAYSELVALDSDVEEQVSAEAGEGEVTVRIPRGEYTVSTEVDTPAPGGEPAVARFVQPKLRLTGDTTVTMDGREARPIAITTPEATEFDGGWLSYRTYDTEGQSVSSSRDWIGSTEGFTFAHVGDTLPDDEFEATLGLRYSKDSTSYTLVYDRRGSYFTGYAHKVDTSELALVDIGIGASVQGKQGRVDAVWQRTGQLRTGMYVPGRKAFALPAGFTQYVNTPAGYEWSFFSGQQALGADPYDNEVSYGGSDFTTYRADTRYDTTYNVGVFSPKIAEGRAVRYDDALSVCPLTVDGAGHTAGSQLSRSRTVVTADGRTVLDTDDGPCFWLDGQPPAEAAYTVSTEISPGAEVAATSTRTRASWTFTSASPGADGSSPLPMSTLTFSPELTPESTARAGTELTVPVTVHGPAAGDGFESLDMSVSYDAGTTWRPAEVTTAANGAKSLTLSHPASATSVSLKAKLTDTDDNTYDLTIIKAYLLT
ncbi:S8 family serine peptidase [Streptomyces sp. NPDC093109]|uniref:S8 family serine peptidase n=1 Tax=Streptomyces sp. NPDC093109 TaxID=3154977 RepID=UPI00344DAAC6